MEMYNLTYTSTLNKSNLSGDTSATIWASDNSLR